MLDPEEFRRYEEWRRNRVEAADDISVDTYNAERAAWHNVWNEGFIAGNSGLTRDTNPYPSLSDIQTKKEAPLI